MKTMTNRERVLKLLNHTAPDRVPWFGDLDYWYSAAQTAGQLPPEYLGDGYFQLNRDLGVGFYLQGFFPFTQHNPDISFTETLDGERQIRTMHTPAGELTEIQQYLPTSSSWGYVKHFVETAADLPAFKCYLESLEFSPAYAEIERRRRIIGDNGVVLVYTPRSPFMQMGTTYVGFINLVYLLADARQEMAELLDLLESKYDRAAEITVASAADCIMIPENLSGEMVGERFYKRFLRPYESKWIQRIRQAGKFSFIHMDGTLKGLLKHVAETGFDVIEAVTPLPSGDMSLSQAAAEITGDTILWGGLPGIVFTPNFGEDAFVAHVKDMLEIMRRKPAYVLGVADQVPPDGILERVGKVAALCDEFGRY
jgi:uroporphyrinogen-III decarboxylase